MGPGESQQWACARVAKSLAAFDPDRAVKLLGPFANESQRSAYLADIAVVTAEHDLDKARAILKGVGSWSAREALTPMAYHVALSQPDKALDLIQELCGTEISNLESVQAKAEALGWVAVAIASSDSKRTWKLIDEALDPCVGPQGNSPRYWRIRGGRSTRAALLAVQAKEIGYPDMESVVHRVLASRMSTKESYSVAAVTKSHVTMAMVLALVDPGTAREVLQSVEPQMEAIGSEASGIRRDAWLQAWALADPGQFPQRLERELSMAKDNPDPNTRWYDIAQMASILIVPPAERLERIARRLGGVWTPGQE
jgi:hypothetical protein